MTGCADRQPWESHDLRLERGWAGRPHGPDENFTSVRADDRRRLPRRPV